MLATTGPAPLEPGGLSKSAGASISVITDSIGGAIGSTLSALAFPLIGIAVFFLLGFALVIGRKVGHELREHRRQGDPRDRYDPDAPDVLGVW